MALVSQNAAKAVEYFTLAANQGDADAQYSLGLCYEYGTGVSQNAAKAVELFTLLRTKTLLEPNMTLVCATLRALE
jgi:hypothetical protein